jgi:histone H3/H4
MYNNFGILELGSDAYTIAEHTKRKKKDNINNIDIIG